MPDFLRRSPRLGLIFIFSALLGACGSFDGASNQLVNAFKPYKMDIVQGNVVTREQVALLRPGMSRIQVRDLLGTSLLASVFHEDRWDYVFSLQRQGAPDQLRKVTVHFKEGVLERFEADPLPSEAEFAATLGTVTASSKRPVLEATPESLQQFPAPAKTAESKPQPPLPVNYPPLESPGR